MSRRFEVSYPGENGEFCTEMWTEEDIKKEYFERWCTGMRSVGKVGLISWELCLEDWIVAHWAKEVVEDEM
jgi:hypothetical protein